MKRVCAVDMGSRNFAWCVVENTAWREPLQWNLEDLWGRRHAKASRDDLFAVALAWAQRNETLLRTCDAIVLERQMRIPFIVMNTVLRTFFHPQVVMVSPKTVGSFWRLPTDRLRKKLAGIETVQRHNVLIPPFTKQDDLADAWLMAVHQMVKMGALNKEQLLV